MTTRKPDDVRDLADPRFDAAWRAASSEEPSPALDDAIRAAARREAGAGPRPADAPATHVPLALRPERWWWPLAAAATIGAVAIGLLQLATPDHVGAPGGDSAVVSDMPAPPQIAQRKSEAVRDEASAAPRMQATEGAARENTAPSTGTPAPPELLSAARPRAGTDATTAPPPVAALRKDTPAPLVAEERRAVPSDTRASAEAKRKADAEMPAPARVAEPFPADAAKRDASEAGAAPPAPPKTAATSEAGVVSGKFAEAPATTGRTERAPEPPRAAPPSAPAQPANVSGASAEDGIAATRTPSFAPQRQAAAGAGTRAGALAHAPAEQSVDAKSERRAPESDHAKLPVADWIVLIRKLIDEGRVDDAAKELAAFRVVHPDHARLLPPDLRDWRPATPR